MEYGLIMAGGAGTRLWPLSRGDMPKQLLPIIKGKSLLQLSYERLAGFLPPERIYVCSAARHAESIFQNLPQLPRENLLGEPQGRDTANAVGFAAAVLLKRDPDAVTAVVTADHVIKPADRFQAAVRTAFEVIAQEPEDLVTFGIIPSHGHTGLGYIHRGEALSLKSGATGAYRVQAFKEKPDKATADRYVESGRYYWNSGMFVWRCDLILRQLQTLLPDAYRGLGQVADAWGTGRQEQVLQRVYPTLPRISIDFAVMEPASQGKTSARIVTVEMDVDWLDVGSWPALADTLDSDEHDNAIDCEACVFLDSNDNIIISRNPDHLISMIGVSDMIIVQTPDATLICPKSDAQRVKELANRVREKYGEKYQ